MGDFLVVEHLLQFAGFGHFADDVAAADELAFDVELRNGRPGGELFDAFTDLHVLEHVDALELNLQRGQNVGDGGGKAALREHRRALHEQDDVVFIDFLLDVGERGIVVHDRS